MKPFASLATASTLVLLVLWTSAPAGAQSPNFPLTQPSAAARQPTALLLAQTGAMPPADPFTAQRNAGGYPNLLQQPEPSQQQPGRIERQAERLTGPPPRNTGLGNSPFADDYPSDPSQIQHDDPIENVSGGAFKPVAAGGTAGATRAAPPGMLPPGASAASGPMAGGPPPGDAQAGARQMLLQARRELAGGNLDQAAAIVSRAKQMGGSFAPHEDSPARVEDLISRLRTVLTGDPRRNAKNIAQLLMEQAEAFLRYNDVATAKQLAEQARSIPVRFQPYEASPDQLLERIANAQGGIPHGGVAQGPIAQRGTAPGQEGAQQESVLRTKGGPPSDDKQPRQIARNGGAPHGMPARGPVDSGDGGKLNQARTLLAQAKLAMDRGQLNDSLELVKRVESLNLPPDAFDNDQLLPWKLRAEIQRTLDRRGPVAFAGHEEDVAPQDGRFPARQSVYNPQLDRSRNAQVSAMQLAPAGSPEAQGGPAPGGVAPGGAEALLHQAQAALRDGDREGAKQLLLEAWRRREELDPNVEQMVQDHLTMLANQPKPQAESLPAGAHPSPLEAEAQKRVVLQEKVRREIISEQAAADRMLQSDPLGAMKKLQDLRDHVAGSGLDPNARKSLLTLVDRAVGRTQKYVDEHRADIENDEHNKAVLRDLDLSRKMTQEKQNTLAVLVDKFNELIDQRRYPEAEIIAKQAREIDPQAEVVETLVWKSKFARRIAEENRIRSEAEDGWVRQMQSVGQSDIPFDDREPWQIGDPHRWEELTRDRLRLLDHQRRPLSDEERKIQEALKKKIAVSFTNRPLSEVLGLLGNVAEVNIYLDPTGLAAEGVSSATPVTINLRQEVSLKSALDLILHPLHLSYVIQNEVLRITSEQTRETDVYTVVYNVADLVIPIPNFIPSYNIGLPGALREAHNALGYGSQLAPSGSSALTIAANEGAASTNASVVAQMGGTALPNGQGRVPQSLGVGPGGLGGGTQPDFDSLIELLVSTIDPPSWNEVGGPGSVSGFPTNLSLVISQTQEVHEQVADLLEQLRRLQDLQVTIEVRFITLNDNFFERIGVDFDFNLQNQSGLVGDGMGGFVTPPGPPPVSGGPSRVFGLDPMGNPTGNLDLTFTQGSFQSALPQFGGFDAATAANFGFAILSDIEVFLVLQAAQGDQRSNVLQAPKVTLFNGQMATVSDQSQTPFVTSVIPVVGDFAAAHMPVIVVLSEGTTLSVQAVVSSDKRFVRLTLVPFFSRIESVQEFTFSGKQTSDSGKIVTDPTGTVEVGIDNKTTTKEGSTVQLPTFAFTTVSTTVSVPDGGTVLLGGIKRLSEGRTERGVPILDKLPYVNRLFKNVGIGRTTQSLMMMVTPRIIIQEEEEERAVGRPLTYRTRPLGAPVSLAYRR